MEKWHKTYINVDIHRINTKHIPFCRNPSGPLKLLLSPRLCRFLPVFQRKLTVLDRGPFSCAFQRTWQTSCRWDIPCSPFCLYLLLALPAALRSYPCETGRWRTCCTGCTGSSDERAFWSWWQQDLGKWDNAGELSGSFRKKYWVHCHRHLRQQQHLQADHHRTRHLLACRLLARHRPALPPCPPDAA